jgi:hypothetical protein
MSETRLKPAYDPRGALGAQEKALAPRIARLDGLRLGILDNTKWNANKLLRRLRDELKAAHALEAANYYRKESFSRFADPALLQKIRAENHVVVTAIGD